MRILVVTQYFWPEQFKILDLCQELVERGHEVTVYTGLPNYPEGHFSKGYSFLGPYREKKGKIQILRVPLIPRGKKKGLQLSLNYLSYFIWASCLAPFLVRGRFDRIFVYEPSPITVAIPAIVLKWLKNAPIVIWVLDLWPESLEATGAVKNPALLNLVRWGVKWIYKRSDRIFVTSRGFMTHILAMGVSADMLKYWPQWAEAEIGHMNVLDQYSDDRLPTEGFKLMFAGNIGSSQDFETIVEAATLLKHKKHIHFVIVGDGLMRPWAEGEVERRGLQSNFHFLGKKPVEMMPFYFSKADAMLVSLTESPVFSLTVPAKVQAYLASGKPILASLNGEGAEIIEQGKAGLVCKATSPQLLAERILQMSMLSPEELKAMGENARRYYLAEFDRAKLISILEDEFRKL